jgi:hypothetical protein
MSYGALITVKTWPCLSFKGYCLGYEFNYSPLQYLKEATAQGAITGIKVNSFLIPSASQSVTNRSINGNCSTSNDSRKTQSLWF